MKIESVAEAAKKEVQNAAKKGLKAISSIAWTKSGASDQSIVIEETDFIVPEPTILSDTEDAGLALVQTPAGESDDADKRVPEREAADPKQSEPEATAAPRAPESESLPEQKRTPQKTQRDRFGRGFRETGNGKRTFTERISEINQATLRK